MRSICIGEQTCNEIGEAGVGSARLAVASQSETGAGSNFGAEEELTFMLSLTQNVVILVITMVASLSFMTILNRVWPCENRRYPNDLIGWQLSVLGTTYAVILGFMLYTVWIILKRLI